MPERTHNTEQPNSPPTGRRLIAGGWIRRAPSKANREEPRRG